MVKYVFLTVIFFSCLAGSAQNIFTCAYGTKEIPVNDVCTTWLQGLGFSNDTEAEQAVDKILSPIGLPRNFYLVHCPDIGNAVAYTPATGVRYILYDRNFIKRVINLSSDWAALTIMAHEIAHHLSGHSNIGARDLPDSRAKELEADEWSGFMLYKLGATLSQAEQAVRIIATDKDDTFSTHPKLSSRLEAIKKGYNRAKEQEDPPITILTDRGVEDNDASIQKGIDAYYAGNYQLAYQIFSVYSKVLNGEAANILGTMYDNGKGVTQDYSEAVRWYRKAAEQGNAQGQCNLGYMYSKGTGVTQDYAEAVRWYRKAAEQGNAQGQCNLGIMYENGKGVTQDYAEAVRWFRKAAEQGNANGQCNLGTMYDNGKGVTQDYAEAVRWFRKAAEQGNAQGQCNLGIMYETGKGVTQDYAEAVRWYRKAAEQGNANGQNKLGIMYETGKGVTQDYAEAVRWYRKAAEQGNAYGQFNLADMYEFGKGVEKNLTEAIKYYRLAANQGLPAAKEALDRLK